MCVPHLLKHLYVPDTILLKIVLLRYNSHIIKFTHLKCNSTALFSRFTELYTCHHYIILGHFQYPRKESPLHLKSLSIPHILSNPCQPVICFLSLWIFQFWISYEWNHRMWSFVTGFEFHLICFQGSSMLSYASILQPFF